jgi:RimJ/RimL family protein N-acetyltransferase
MKEYRIRKADKQDIKLLFDWANDPEVRKASFSTHEITWEEHSKWYEKVLNSENVVIYVLTEDDVPVGQARFTVEDGIADIGYSIGSEFRSRGLATRLLKMAMWDAVKERKDIIDFQARVKRDNIASLRVFEKLGFRKDKDSLYKAASEMEKCEG